MQEETYDQLGTKFKILLVASIGMLVAVITLGEMGII